MNENLDTKYKAEDAEAALGEFSECQHAVFGCGHTVDLSAHARVCDASDLVWIATVGLCRDCWISKETALAAAHAQENGLPQLRGSYPQQNWALSIRYNILMEIQADRDAGVLGPRLSTAVDVLVTKVSAGWWIGHRMNPVMSLLSDFTAAQPVEVPKPTFRGDVTAEDYFASLR